MAKTYSEKLKDPRWQKKRLQVLNLFGFKCSECESEKKTLHVHHKYYKKNADPWDYDDYSFCILCEDCHKVREQLRDEAIQSIGYFDNENLRLLNKLISMTGYGPWSFPRLVNFLDSFRIDTLALEGIELDEEPPQ